MENLRVQELRIGNYINIDLPISDEGKLTSIGAINSKKVNGVEIWKYKPIPLTEEWLLKFGFSEKLGNWELPNFRFHINKPMNFDGFIFCEGYSVITDKIQFVHQLQNLIFALTGEELIFNQ